MGPTKSYGSGWAGFRLVHAGNEKGLMKRSIGCRINLQEARLYKPCVFDSSQPFSKSHRNMNLIATAYLLCVPFWLSKERIKVRPT